MDHIKVIFLKDALKITRDMAMEDRFKNKNMLKELIGSMENVLMLNGLSLIHE